MDRNYPGPCGECCPTCSDIFPTLPDSITADISGIAQCGSGCYAIGPGNSFIYDISGFNGSYTLTRVDSGLFTYSIPDAGTISNYLGSDCNTLIDSTTASLYFNLFCGPNGMAFGVDSSNSSSYGIWFGGYTSSFMTNPFTINNQNDCSSSPDYPGYGSHGSVTISW